MDSQAMFWGSDDDGDPPRFSGVVALYNLGGGWCSGVVVSPQVVATAAHCFRELKGCFGEYRYLEPDPGNGHTRTGWRLRVTPAGSASFQDWADPACPPYSTAPGWPDVNCEFGIDGVTFHPDIALTVHDCCPDDPICFDVCLTGTPPAGNKFSDLALVHLDRPLPPYYRPVEVLYRVSGPDKPEEGTFALDPVAWTGGDTRVFVSGTSRSDTHDGERFRIDGLNVVDPEHGVALPQPKKPYTCEDLAKQPEDWVAESCDSCVIHTSHCPDEIPPDGGPHSVGGDSGSPVIANAAALGATDIPELPGDVPYVTGILSAGPLGDPQHCDDGHRYTATWDAPTGLTANNNNGTWLLARRDDFDTDGVPDDEDNCPVTPNGDQANCNEDAEHFLGFAKRGDACDPIPCASAIVAEGETQIVTSIESTFLVLRSGRVIRDRLSVFPRGSHYWGNGSHEGRPLVEIQVPDVEVYYRVCVPAPGINCWSDDQVIDDLLLFAQPQGLSSDPEAPWLLPSVQWHPSFSPIDHEPFDHPLHPDLDVGVERTWLYQEDYQSWLGNNWIPQTESDEPVFGWGTNMQVRFWIHSDTTAGTLGNPAAAPDLPDGSTGYRMTVAGAAANGGGLANHYFDLEPDRRVHDALVRPLALDPYLDWRWVGPDPFALDGWDGLRREDGFLVATEQGIGLLRRDGWALSVDELIRPDLASLLLGGTAMVVPAAEPRLNVGPQGETAGFHAVVFAADGTDVIDGVLRSGLELGTTVDFARPPVGKPGSPTAREGFTAVFSRGEDAAWVLGGTDLESGDRLHDIWMRRVETEGAWRQVQIAGYAPGRVLAATWSFLDHRLWILDVTGEHGGGCAPPKVAVCHQAAGKDKTLCLPEPAAEAHLGHGDATGPCAGDGGRGGGGGPPQVRLVRIDPYLGVHEPVGSWAPSGGHRDHWLVVDRDGQVLLVSSSHGQSEHAVARLWVKALRGIAPVGVDKLERRSGRLAFRPLVDRTGYTFVTRQGDDLLVERRDALGGAPASLADLGGVL